MIRYILRIGSAGLSWWAFVLVTIWHMHFLSKSPFYCLNSQPSKHPTASNLYHQKLIKKDWVPLNSQHRSPSHWRSLCSHCPRCGRPTCSWRRSAALVAAAMGGGDDGCGEKKTNAIPILGFVKRGWLVVLPLTYLSALSFSSHSAPSSQCDLLTTVSTRLAMVLTKA